MYMDRVLEAVRKDSPNRHVDETHLRKLRLRLYALAVRGPSCARIQIYGYVAEHPCVTVLNQKPIAHTGLSSHFCPGWTGNSWSRNCVASNLSRKTRDMTQEHW
jgi:hypothetical protein